MKLKFLEIKESVDDIPKCPNSIISRWNCFKYNVEGGYQIFGSVIKWAAPKVSPSLQVGHEFAFQMQNKLSNFLLKKD